MAFYGATSKINSITKSITDFLEKVPMRDWDGENKVFHDWNFLHTEIKENYNNSDGKIFWVDSHKTRIYIKISKDYELVMHLNWAEPDDLNQTLESYKIYVRGVDRDWDEKEYPSYFKSSFTDNAANSGMSSVLTELQEAVRMKKDDWKRKEI